MKERLLNDQGGERVFSIVLAKDDEVVPSLQTFVTAWRIKAAQFSAIGAFSAATLGYFDWETKNYVEIPVAEQTEVASLLGDVARGEDGKPALHMHCVLGRRDGSTRAGHLLRATVRPTLEVILTESPAHLRKRCDPETGLALIDPTATGG